MEKKKICFWFLKAAAAFILSLIAVNLCCLLYYNIPAHYDNPSNATDYKFEASTYFSRWTPEGLSHGKTNNDGFLNLLDAGEKEVNILFMGSSHGEGYNVNMDENTVAVLNDRLDGKMYAYNIATSSHTLLINLKNLEAALETYQPTDYVIIEFPNIQMDIKKIQATLDETVARLPSQNSELTALLQKIPYFRLLYSQLVSAQKAETDPAEAETKPTQPDQAYSQALNTLLEKAGETAKKHQVKLILLYHSHPQLEQDGSLIVTEKTDYLKAMETACDMNQIQFINMTDIFITKYNETHRLPYGFINTAVGVGHLNRYGHQWIGETLYKAITGDAQ